MGGPPLGGGGVGWFDSAFSERFVLFWALLLLFFFFFWGLLNQIWFCFLGLARPFWD